MAMSGLAVDPTVSAIYDDMRLRSTNRYVFFKMENRKSIIIDETGDPSKTYDDFEQKLTEIEANRDCRYAIFNFDIHDGARRIEKIAFIFWCPESVSTINKMIYSSCKDDVKRAFTGITFEFKATTLDQLRYEDLKAEIIRKS